MALAYVSLALPVTTLAIGPLNVLRRRPNPISTHPRRDLGIWGGALGLLHVVVGLQVHLPGRMSQYFLTAPPDASRAMPRMDAFGVANDAGLVAAIVLVLLLALSNDASLRRLRTRRWKQIQRTNYAGMMLLAIHGVLYQALEKRTGSFVLIYAALLLVAASIQYAGYRAQ